MTNTNQYSDEQWYPQLPEGFTGEGQGMQGGMDGWMPGAGMPNYGMMPGAGMPNYGMMPGAGMPNYGMMPGAGMPNYGMMPGAGMPNYGMMPGSGMPNYDMNWGGSPMSAMPSFDPPGFPGQGGPGFPGGFPGPGGPGFPGGGSPSGQGGQQAPTAPPPNYTPSYPGGNQAQLFAVDPGAIRGCLYRYTYVWTSRRNGFWFYPTFVGRTSVAGFRWRPSRRRWEYFGIDLNRIDQFTCF